MKAVHDKIEGPFAIEEDLALYGMVTGGATLRRGVKLILHGTIAGDLTLEPGARAIIHGTVAGRICNEGGRAEMIPEHAAERRHEALAGALLVPIGDSAGDRCVCDRLEEAEEP